MNMTPEMMFAKKRYLKKLESKNALPLAEY